MTDVWFTSDLHFNHKQVITYCNRPYSCVAEMNECLIDNWNETVKPEDTIYVLGDFAFSGSTLIKEIVHRLHGTKILVMGNHDYRYKAHRWVEFGFSEAIHKGKVGAYNLSHFPYKEAEHDVRKFDQQLENDGSYLLHGHVHQHWVKRKNMVNVGVDVWNYRPVHLDRLAPLFRT